MHNKPHTIEAKLKDRLSHLGKPSGFKGKKHTEKTKEKMKLAKLKNPARYWLGKKRSKETIEKIRNKKKGQNIGNQFAKGNLPNRTSFKKGEHHGVEFGKDKRVDGKYNHNWKGGTSFEPYGIEFNKELKTEIRKRDKFTCQECDKNGFVIHHIDYNKKNNNPTNLITLCRSCNFKANYNREDWTKCYQNKLNNRSRRD